MRAIRGRRPAVNVTQKSNALFRAGSDALVRRAACWSPADFARSIFRSTGRCFCRWRRLRIRGSRLLRRRRLIRATGRWPISSAAPTPSCAGMWGAAIARLRSMNDSGRGSIRSLAIRPMAIRGWLRSTRSAFDAGIDQTLCEGACARVGYLLLYTTLQQVIAFATLSGHRSLRPVLRILQFAGRDLARRGDEGRGGARRGVEFFGELHLRERGGADSDGGRPVRTLRDSAAPVFRGGNLARGETDAAHLRHAGCGELSGADVLGSSRFHRARTASTDSAG